MFTTSEDHLCAQLKKAISSKKGFWTSAAAGGRRCCSGEEICCAPGETHEKDFPIEQMEFWGTEVVPGKPQVNEPGDDTYIHVSQVALGPSKEGKEGKSERVVIRVQSGGKNVVLGTLCSGKVDQMTLDLIFDREFTLSHTSTSCSVFFCGYRTDKQQDFDDSSDEDEDDDEDEDEDDEPVPMAITLKENGTSSAKEGKVTKKQVKVVEKVEAKLKKADKSKPSLIEKEAEEGEESDEDGEDDDDEEEDEVDDEGGVDLGSDSDDDDDDDDEDDEDDDDEDDEDDEDDYDMAPELGKKRSLQGSAKKSPGEGKKPRLDTPAKPGRQTAAEHWERLATAGDKGLITTPGKKGAKGDAKSTPTKKELKEAKGTTAKTPQKTPGKETVAKTPKTTTPGPAGESAKKLGAHHCAECNRNFASDSALTQHAVAKHKK